MMVWSKAARSPVISRHPLAGGASLLVALLLVPACGVAKVVKPEAPGFIGFEEGKRGEAPPNWTIDSPELYRLELDPEVKRSGFFSGRLTHVAAATGSSDKGQEDRGRATRCVDARLYRGGVVRVSGFLKFEGGETAAMVVSGDISRGTEPGTFTYKPPLGAGDIEASTNWTEYWIMTTLPGDLSEFCISLAMKGVGTLWADDISIQKVEVSSLSSSKIHPLPLPNLDMETVDAEGVLADWFLHSPEPGKELRPDPEVKRSGALSARLSEAHDEVSTGFPADAFYCPDPDPFIGKVTRVSAWLRTSEERPFRNALLHLVSRRDEVTRVLLTHDVERAAGWTSHELITSVPAGVTELCFGFDVFHSTIWADDFRVETLDL